MLTVGRALIFCVVLFFYLHIHYHLKTSSDLEVYELSSPSKETLEEICDLRQPTRFDFRSDSLTSRIRCMEEEYGAFEVRVRDMTSSLGEGDDPYVALPLGNVAQALERDKNSRYVIESNSSFLDETGLAKTYSAADPYLRPYMVASRTYDVLAGSRGARTQLRRELNYRTYFISVMGSVSIKLAPPKADRYLYPVYDYCNFEFRSPVDPWAPQAMYESDFAKVKCLDVQLAPGQALFVPAYWWYSIEFSSHEDRVACCKYTTYMSALATANHSLLWALQSQNLKHTVPTERLEGPEELPGNPKTTISSLKQESTDVVPPQPKAAGDGDVQAAAQEEEGGDAEGEDKARVAEPDLSHASAAP